MKYFIMNNYQVKGSNQHEKIKALLNHLCGMKNDSLLTTEFKVGIINDCGKLNVYFATDETFEHLLKQKFKLIYQSVEFEEYDMENLNKRLQENNSRFGTMKLKYSNEKKITINEPQNTFMDSLLNALYSKNNYDLNIIEMNFKPIVSISNNNKTKEKHSTIGKRILIGTLKGAMFLAESMFPSLESNDNNNKDTKISISDQQSQISKFEYNTSINIAVSSSDSTINQNHLIIKLRNIASIYSQLNQSNVFYYETVKDNYFFTKPQYAMKLTTDEIYQFLYLPDEAMLSNILGASDTKILVEKSIPIDGILIGEQSGKEPVCLPAPSDILCRNKYHDIYMKKSTIVTSTEDKQYKNISNGQIIDNMCKSQLIMGLPGTGKSEFINNYAVSCLRRGLPFICMDPKYDTQKRLIESIPEEYINNIEFLDLGDLVYPPALNIFRRRKKDDATENALVTTSFISYMKKQFDRSWGYNLERMIQMTTDAILMDDVSTMSEFYFMLTEQDYRTAIIEIIKAKLDEPNVDNKSRLRQLLKYWSDYEERFKKNPGTVSKEIEPVMNKVGAFIGNRFINAIVSQRESYDFKAAGDNGKSVIINIPEGIISQDNMSLLSGFVNKAIWADFQSRDDMEISRRYPVQWLIDEAHTMIDSEIVGIMQKARSRRLGLTLITQTLTSLDMKNVKISDIIMDNCKTKLTFRIGAYDARTLSEEFSPLTSKDLSECPDYHYYGKILLPNGTVSKPFYAIAPKPLPVLRNYDDYKENHRSGKMTINEIEDDIENRLERFRVANQLVQ